MRLATAAAGSSAFFALAPGVVAGVIPWWLTGWDAEPVWPPLRWLGALLLVAGAIVLIRAFARFVAEGLGTPAPVAPTEKLVVGGIYRHVRNPMYVAVLSIILGQALLFVPWRSEQTCQREASLLRHRRRHRFARDFVHRFCAGECLQLGDLANTRP